MTPTTIIFAAIAIIAARSIWTTLRHDRRVQMRINRWRQLRAQRALEEVQRGR